MNRSRRAKPSDQKVAVVTGASSGIGAATARALAAEGYSVVCAARRGDRINRLAAEIDGFPVPIDITSAASVAELAEVVGDRVDVLVNNAGGALDAATAENADIETWAAMYELNVLGTLRVVQALLPALRATDHGLVVNMGSTAGRAAYPGGGGYTTAKGGLRTLTETLRLEHVAEPVRFVEVAPGMVATEEFGLVRFGGDQARRDQVYEGVAEPLVAEDVAEVVRWITTLPRHVSIDEIVVRPKAQAAQHLVHRGPLRNP